MLLLDKVGFFNKGTYMVILITKLILLVGVLTLEYLLKVVIMADVDQAVILDYIEHTGNL